MIKNVLKIWKRHGARNLFSFGSNSRNSSLGWLLLTLTQNSFDDLYICWIRKAKQSHSRDLPSAPQSGRHEQSADEHTCHIANHHKHEPRCACSLAEAGRRWIENALVSANWYLVLNGSQAWNTVDLQTTVATLGA